MSSGLLLDRFVWTGNGGWRDLATGRSVWVRTSTRVRSPHAPLAWDRFLVHPRTTPGWIGLVDCGYEGRHRWIEAYDLRRAPAPWRGSREATDRCIASAARIARRCGLEVAPGLQRWIRDVRGAPAFLPVPARAVVFAGRRTADRDVQAVRSLLDDLDQDCRRTVAVPSSLDVGRARIPLLAHHARLRGLVPVSGGWGLPGSAARATAAPRLQNVLRHRRVLVLRGERAACGCVREAREGFGEPAAAEAWPPGVAATLAGAASLVGRGRHAAARRRLLMAAAAAQRRGDGTSSGVLWLMLGRALRARGRVSEAERAVRRARASFGQDRSGRGTAACHLEMAWLAWDDDRLDESAGHAASALSAAQASGDTAAVAAGRWFSAYLACWDGRVHDVRAQLSGFDGLDGHEAPGAAAAADACAECPGDGPMAALSPLPGAALLARLVRARAGVPGRTEAHGYACEGPADFGSWMVPDRLALREATILECAARGDRRGAHDALALGLREARLGHAPLMALSLRLTAAECQTGGADGHTLRRWIGAALPAMYRRRLKALVSPAAAPARRAREAGTASVTPADIIALVQVFNEAADERSALEGVCEQVRERLGIAAVSVFAWRHGQARLLANAGVRPCDAVAAARAADRGAVWHVDAAGGEVFAAIRWAGDVIGVAAARGLPGTTVPAGVPEAFFAALTSAAAGSVRALGDALGLPSEPPGATAGILGVSRAVAVLRGLVLRAGATSFPVLIEGESGTGKELAAKAVHLAGERRGRRFCAVNCAALSEDLLEAELFGHARGAFTGASTDRPGLFEEADGGTLFLDEISELSPRGQAKLLRAIQEREIRRVGENSHRRVDVRIVCATNKPLGDEVVAGRFRQDLFYRLDVVRIHVPPLRERPEDVPLLADKFWREALGQTGGRAILSSETVAALAGRPWPGNIRELQNTLAALAVRAPRHGRIGPRDLTWLWPDAAGGRPFPRTLDDARRAFEVEFVRSVLDRAGGRRCRAAAELGVTRQGLAKLVTRLGITQAGRAGAAWGGPVAPESRALSQTAVQREERGVLRKHVEAPRHGG